MVSSISFSREGSTLAITRDVIVRGSWFVVRRSGSWFGSWFVEPRTTHVEPRTTHVEPRTTNGSDSDRVRFREPARELLGGVIGGEEALDLQLLQRDVARRGELGDRREERHRHITAPKLHRHQRIGGRHGVGLPPSRGDSGIRQQFVAQLDQHGAAGGRELAVEAVQRTGGILVPVYG